MNIKRNIYFFIVLFSIITLIHAQEIGAKYLIITHDNFYDAILPYAQWKHKMGYRTKIVRVPSHLAQNSTSIRNYIVNAYNNWQIRPEFILFVGGYPFIPWSFSSDPYGDNNYTNMDYDIYNEILSGRLTVRDISQAQTVVEKMLKYERYPDISDSLWFKKGCLIANAYEFFGFPDDDSARYREDIQYVAGLMVDYDYIRVDTFYALNGYNANSVVSATNNGRGFVLYRGSATNNWYPPFAVNPDGLANGNKLPIVVSVTCATLGTGSTPATAERWFLTGTPTTLRGGAGYFATTTSGTGIARHRSAVARGFFDGLFLYKRRTFGEACEDGRLRVYNTYYNADEYRGFTTVGDPAMQVWTARPRPITVLYDTLLYVGIAETLNVAVSYQGTPVESAFVCILFDTLIYRTGYTDNNGEVRFVFTPPMPGSMDITVTGRNLYPYEGVIQVITGINEASTFKDGNPLLSAYPNPFTTRLDIRYEIPNTRYRITNGHISDISHSLKIYDATGRLVKDFSRLTFNVERSTVLWDGTDDLGREVPQGVYFVHLKFGNFGQIKKGVKLQ